MPLSPADTIKTAQSAGRDDGICAAIYLNMAATSTAVPTLK